MKTLEIHWQLHVADIWVMISAFDLLCVEMSKYLKVNSCSVNREPPRGKTNNVVSEQVRHKPACTVTEAG